MLMLMLFMLNDKVITSGLVMPEVDGDREQVKNETEEVARSPKSFFC